MEKQAKKLKINLRFFNAIYVKENPVRGCLLSHLNIIKGAKERKLKNILIIEDDCYFTKNPNKIKKLPEKWDMLYFGGNLCELYENVKPNWVKMSCWTTHSYVINNTIYDVVIKDLENYTREVDRYYKDIIHPKYLCYMINPIITKQKDGYSDIENKNTTYIMRNFCDMYPIRRAESEIRDGNIILKLPNISDKSLPKVSILTPTYNRKNFFKLAIHNFNSFIYPRDKLEWVIVDDGQEDLSDILPNDKRIKYVKIKSNKLSISFKRNLCVKYATSDYFVHMDDDDVYFSTSILSRIKTLLKYKSDCVCCTSIGCYDLTTNSSYVITNKYDISEASMCYTRKFFNERKFDKNIIKGEGRLFIRNRRENIVQIPYEFVMIALNHSNNLTEDLRVCNIGNNLQFVFDDDILKILEELK